MSEKVKLPKEVCYVLDYIRLKQKSVSDIIKALSVGYEPIESDEELYGAGIYEPESQPERKLKQLVQNIFNGEKDLYDMGYRYGAWDALRIHGIHYDWLEGAE